MKAATARGTNPRPIADNPPKARSRKVAGLKACNNGDCTMTDTQHTPGPSKPERANTARLLMAYGFSVPKAWEVALDYERGDTFAAAFVRAANVHANNAAIAKATKAQS